MPEYLGYHGTKLQYATNILDSGFQNSKDDEWLGQGIYFFGSDGAINGLQEAKDWAIYVKKIQIWAVVQSRLIADKPLDMVYNIRHRKLFDEVRKICYQKHIEYGKHESEFCDYIIFNYLDEHYDFDLVSAYTEGSKNRYGYISNIVRRPQIQICVKKQSCIEHTEIVSQKE